MRCDFNNILWKGKQPNIRKKYCSDVTMASQTIQGNHNPQEHQATLCTLFSLNNVDFNIIFGATKSINTQIP